MFTFYFLGHTLPVNIMNTDDASNSILEDLCEVDTSGNNKLFPYFKTILTSSVYLSIQFGAAKSMNLYLMFEISIF